MKYAMLDIETIGVLSDVDKVHINYGDHYQSIIVQDIYRSMGISKDELYLLDFNALYTYDGEEIILPINFMYEREVHKFSSKITPIFFGFTFSQQTITPEDQAYFLKYAPIGCRDEGIYQVLQNHGIPAYIQGCITMTSEKRSKVPENGKVYIVDVPAFALEVIPQHLKEHAVIRSNVVFDYIDRIRSTKTLEDLTREMYLDVRENASLVITSRLHLASPCIAMGIPVVVIRDHIDIRWSWIDKFIPIYNATTVDKINWDPVSLDVENVKTLLQENMVKTLEYTYQSCALKENLTAFYEDRSRIEYEKDLLGNELIEFVQKNFKKSDSVQYSVWGANKIAEKFCVFLEEQFPNFSYTACYDTYRTIEFRGITSRKPQEMSIEREEFVFVTSFNMYDFATEFFSEIKKEPSSYYIIGENSIHKK